MAWDPAIKGYGAATPAPKTVAQIKADVNALGSWATEAKTGSGQGGGEFFLTISADVWREWLSVLPSLYLAQRRAVRLAAALGCSLGVKTWDPDLGTWTTVAEP